MIVTLEDGRRIDVPQELVTEIEKYENKCKYFHDIAQKDGYYMITSNGVLQHFANNNDWSDEQIHDNINAFSTREFAQKMANRQLLERKLIKFSLENGGEDIDWNDCHAHKYYIYFDSDGDALDVSSCAWSKIVGTVFFYSKDIAFEAITLFNNELLQYYKEWSV